MMHGCRVHIPDTNPELTDPLLAPTAADVVALVIQHLQVAGRQVSLSAESMDAASAHAELMLAVLGVPAT
ncbi:hypothetical protein GCM10009539_58830 [Cryptosporangium japonicum]|uniref:Uncharacterized protein n=1 Tax=Cryptosporangium japonicum TaxID=80872 RepID=A0ABN0UXJ2_9ACTN